MYSLPRVAEYIKLIATVAPTTANAPTALPNLSGCLAISDYGVASESIHNFIRFTAAHVYNMSIQMHAARLPDQNLPLEAIHFVFEFLQLQEHRAR